MSLAKRKKAMVRVLTQGKDVRKSPGLARKFRKKSKQVERMESHKRISRKRRSKVFKGRWPSRAEKKEINRQMFGGEY